MKEIDNVLDQETIPTLEKSRKEWAQYMQWANGNGVLDTTSEVLHWL